MLSFNIIVGLFKIGLATLSRGQIVDSAIKLEDTFISQPNIIKEVDNSSDVNISLFRCCQGGEYYKPFIDSCPIGNPVDNSTETHLGNLLVYSTKSNQLINASERVELTSGSILDCPDGFFGNSTTIFKLFDDGSLRTGEKRYEPKSFCINPIDSRDPTSLTLVARFCDPDPCSVNGMNCIRKCCPLGMAMSQETLLCEPYPIPFNMSELRGEDSSPINLEIFTVYGGLGVKCLRLGVGINRVNPKDFVILSDGLMKNLDYPCKVLEFDERTTENYCVDHLFSDNETEVLAVRCYPSTFDETDPEGLTIFPYLMLFSTVFIIATVFIYAILPKLRNKFGVIVMCYFVSIAISYLGLATIQLYRNMPEGVCATLPVLVHYSYLATFTWLNVVCFDLWRTFRVEHRSKTTRQFQRNVKIRLGPSFIIYSIYGWGLPLVVVAIGQILQYVENSWRKCAAITPGFAEDKCWFHLRSSLIAYLYGPIGVMILFNVIMFVWTGFKFYTSSLKTKQATGNTRVFQRYRVIFSLFLLMGVSWATEVISFMTHGTFKQWVVTDCINILTGFFVFVIFICKPTVWQMLKSKFTCLPLLSSFWRRFLTTFSFPNVNPRNSTLSGVSSCTTPSTSATELQFNSSTVNVSSHPAENSV